MGGLNGEDGGQWDALWPMGGCGDGETEHRGGHVRAVPGGVGREDEAMLPLVRAATVMLLPMALPTGAWGGCGWYLLAPPVALGGVIPGLEAPLSRWTQLAGFDQPTACEQERVSRIKKAAKEMEDSSKKELSAPERRSPPDLMARFESATQLSIVIARCIPTYDSRLRQG